MNICILASGSKGNSTYFETNDTKNLIDLGINCLYIENKLSELNINPHDINNIFITHTHVDHISGLKVFIKKYNPKIFLSELMYKELSKQITIPNYFIIGDHFEIKDLQIDTFKTSHDAPDSFGYIFESREKSFVYVTDTGYINVKNHDKLKNRNLYVIESNHDINMLMNGKYPYYLKQRVLGDRGHLSNKDSADYLSKFIGDKTSHIVLVHLSEENNTRELALNTIRETLFKKDKSINNIIIAEQNEKSELIKL